MTKITICNISCNKANETDVYNCASANCRCPNTLFGQSSEHWNEGLNPGERQWRSAPRKLAIEKFQAAPSKVSDAATTPIEVTREIDFRQLRSFGTRERINKKIPQGHFQPFNLIFCATSIKTQAFVASGRLSSGISMSRSTYPKTLLPTS